MAHAAMLHEEDPAVKLRSEVGDLSSVDVFHNQVLVAVYKRPEKTASGLYLAKTTLNEDQYQSKVGLVLAKGPQAFVDNAEWRFPTPVECGDWIVYQPSNGWAITIGNVLCRMLVDTSIKAKVAHPDAVW